MSLPFRFAEKTAKNRSGIG